MAKVSFKKKDLFIDGGAAGLANDDWDWDSVLERSEKRRRPFENGATGGGAGCFIVGFGFFLFEFQLVRTVGAVLAAGRW